MSSTRPVAIVTGAARGIGLAVSRALLERGWCVVMTDLSADVEQAAKELNPESDVTFTVVGDVTSPETQDRLCAATDLLGRLDGLVNNAGIGGPGKDALTLTGEEFRQVLEVNLLAPFELARRAAAVMISQGWGGRIVNMGSVFGQQAVVNGSAYCASKGAVALLSQALAIELGPHGITVNTVAPGYILTDMHLAEIASRAAHVGRSIEEERSALAQSVPLRRHGTPADVADTVAWLLSDTAGYVTGQTVSVNGGILLS